MKKVAILLCAVVALCFGAVEAADIHVGHDHGIFQECAGSVWQCSKCGQRWYGGANRVPSNYGCGGNMYEQHVWQRIQ